MSEVNEIVTDEYGDWVVLDDTCKILVTPSELWLQENTKSLEQVKHEKKEEIYQVCEKTILDGFVSTVTDDNGVPYEFYYDTVAQTKFNGQTNKFNIWMNQLSLGKITQEEYNAKFPIMWRTKSHGWVGLSESEYLQVTDDAENHERVNLQKRSQIEVQIDNCTTNDEVWAITWT